MSQPVENVLYIGPNIQLVKTVFHLSNPTAAASNYSLHHLTGIEQALPALAEKTYTHLICELPVTQNIVEQIAADFPLLQTTYLAPLEAPKTRELAQVMEELVSDEVKATLDYLSIPVYFKNRKGQFVACNSYFSHLFGLTPAQVVGKTAADVLYPHLLDEIERIDQKVFTERQVYFYECKIQDLAGGERDMVFRKECVADGKVQIGMLFDVTEINAARALLDKERLMLRATADISQDLIFFKDQHSAFLGCNKQFEKFTGLSEQQILGKKDAQLFESSQSAMCQVQDLDVMANNQIYIVEKYLTDAKGKRHLIEMKKVPVQNKQGEVIGLIAVGRDITRHHRMQKRLNIADTVVENSKENIVVTDEAGNIISANAACCATSGFSKSELLGEHVRIFAASQRENIEIALQQKGTWEGEITFRLKSGEIHFAWLEVYAIKQSEKELTRRIYSFVDINQSKNAEEKIQFLSKRDPLTGLFNRIALFTRLEDALTRANHKEAAMAVILVDINGFKTINEQFGHNAGDDVLKDLAGRLCSCVFNKDTVARFGGDEFVIIVDELSNEQDAAAVAKKIAKQFEQSFTIEGCAVNLSATIGISLWPDDGSDGDTLLGHAEKAMQRGKAGNASYSVDANTHPDSLDKKMYNSKNADRTVYHFYTGILTQHSRQQLKLEEELKQAVQEEQFELYYQPQYDLNKLQPVAVEALLRWHHPQRGTLYPDSFLSLAESSGLLADIGLQMLRKAAMQAVIWKKSAINFGRVAIKLPAQQLAENDFIAQLQSILLQSKCSSQWLEFQIDEAVFASICPVVRTNLVNISKLGIALTLDNFGEDRPFLQLFEQLRIEKLKISKHYTEGCYSHFVGEGIQQAMRALTRSLGIDLVAESLHSTGESSAASADNLAPGKGWLENNAMNPAEATFYLRCHKRK